MTVLSTLRTSSDEAMSMMPYVCMPVRTEAQYQRINTSNSASAVTTCLMPLSVLPDVNHILGNDDGGLHGNHLTAPMDGEGKAVWFCSECKDGPYLLWQSSCQSCQHSKCSHCRVEDGN